MKGFESLLNRLLTDDAIGRLAPAEERLLAITQRTLPLVAGLYLADGEGSALRLARDPAPERVVRAFRAALMAAVELEGPLRELRENLEAERDRPVDG